MRQAEPGLWPFTRLPRLGDPSGPSLAPQKAEPLAPCSFNLCTRPSRGPPRSPTVVPLIQNQRYYGGAPMGLRRCERVVARGQRHHLPQERAPDGFLEAEPHPPNLLHEELPAADGAFVVG